MGFLMGCLKDLSAFRNAHCVLDSSVFVFDFPVKNWILSAKNWIRLFLVFLFLVLDTSMISCCFSKRWTN